MKALFLATLMLAALWDSSPVRAEYTCETVARNGQLDPDDEPLRPSFGPEVAVNASGDTLFTARPIRTKVKLYLYEGGGAAETIAAGNAAAPNGGTYRASSAFRDYSIDDAGDLVFLGRLRPGQGIFVRASGGPLVTLAETTGMAPNGGVWDEFPSVARINASGDVAFTALVLGAPGGVFVFDAGTATTSAAVEDGTPTAGGRVICSTLALALGDSGAIALRALVAASDCVLDPQVEAILLADGGPPAEVALVGDPSPIGGTVYANFDDAPRINAGGKVAFRADVVGLVDTSGIFLHDPGGPATSVVVRRGDAVPVGGAIGKLIGFDLADSDRVFVRSALSTSTARFGVFAFNGAAETILVKTSAPPTDAFGIGAVFSNLEVPGFSPSSERIALYAKVRDTVAPRGRRAILRCGP